MVKTTIDLSNYLSNYLSNLDLIGLSAALLSLGGATTLGAFVITNGLAVLAVFGSVVGVLGPSVFAFSIPAASLGVLSALGITLILK